MQSAEPFNYNERYGLKKGRSWIAVALITAVVGGWLDYMGRFVSLKPFPTSSLDFLYRR
jgi:hypothetical protein